MVNATLRRQGIIVTKVKQQRLGRGGRVTEKDIALFTRQLATMMKAGVPLLQAFDIVGKGHQPGGRAAADRHQDRSRDRLLPRTGVPQVPAVFRRPVLQPGRRGRAGRYSRSAARPPGDLQGKDPRHQVQDQVGAVLSGRRSSWSPFIITAVIMIFVIPAFKQRVHELRRRPARADAVRDGDLGLLRRLLVHHLPRASAAAIYGFL